MRQKRGEKPGGDAPKPDDAPKIIRVVEKKTWAGLINDQFHHVITLFGWAIKAGALSAALSEPGRELIGEAGAYAGTVLSGARNLTLEMISVKTRFAAFTVAFMIAQFIISGNATHHQVRIPMLTSMFGLFVLAVAVVCRATAAWWLSQGAIWKGLEKIDQKNLTTMLQGNPLPLLFTTIQPAVVGGLSQLENLGRFMAWMTIQVLVGTILSMQPFFRAPVGLWVAALIVTGFTMLSLKKNEDKWQLWFLYLFMMIFLLVGVSALAWMPWLVDIIAAGGTWTGIVCFLFLGSMAIWGVMWSSKQSAQHELKMAAILAGKPAPVVATSSGGSSGWSRLAGQLAGPAVGLIAIIVVFLLWTGSMARATDGFRKVIGMNNWLVEHKFDQTGRGKVQGINAITTATEPVASEVTTKSTTATSVEVITAKLALAIQLGPMRTGLTVQPGDSVAITVQTPVCQAYDTDNNVVNIPTSGMFEDGVPAIPAHMPRVANFVNHFPCSTMMYGTALARVGERGETQEIGRSGQFRVTGGGAQSLLMYLNLPVVENWQGALVPNQKLDVIVTIYRPRH